MKYLARFGSFGKYSGKVVRIQQFVDNSNTTSETIKCSMVKTQFMFRNIFKHFSNPKRNKAPDEIWPKSRKCKINLFSSCLPFNLSAKNCVLQQNVSSAFIALCDRRGRQKNLWYRGMWMDFTINLISAFFCAFSEYSFHYFPFTFTSLKIQGKKRLLCDSSEFHNNKILFCRVKRGEKKATFLWIRMEQKFRCSTFEFYCFTSVLLLHFFSFPIA